MKNVPTKSNLRGPVIVEREPKTFSERVRFLRQVDPRATPTHSPLLSPDLAKHLRQRVAVASK